MGLTKLLTAVYDGKFSSVKRLVEKGADLGARTGKKDTPLHLATLKGFIHIMTYLLEKDIALLNMTNSNGETPLYQACTKGNLAAVKVLVIAGANLETSNRYDNTPLHQAAGEGYTASQEDSVLIVELLISNNARVGLINSNGETPLHRAALKGNAPAVAKLVNAGADVLAKNKNGNTPLHQAAAEKHLNVVEKICSLAPNSISALNRNDETPLHKAAYTGKGSVVKALLNFEGCDIYAKNKFGNTPLHLAAASRVEGAVQELLCFQRRRGSLQEFVNVTNNLQQRPLHRAASEGRLRSVELLLDAGAEVDAIQEDRYTALQLATIKGERNLEVMKKLLDKNASMYNVNSQGSTGAHHAAFNGNYEVLKLLLGKGFDVNYKNRKGNTLLHLAAREGHTNIVNLLLELRANLDIYNKNGDSAVNLAARLGQTEIVLKLLGKGASPLSLGNEQSVLHAAAIGKRLHTIQCISTELPTVVEQFQNKTWKECTEEEWANIVGCPHTAWWLHKKSMTQLHGIKTQQHRINTDKKWQACRDRYEISGLNVIDRAKSGERREGDWLLKSISDSEIEMHFMDGLGNTPLHAAVASKSQDIEIKLGEAGALFVARNHRNQKPHETDGLVNYSEPKLPVGEMDKLMFSRLYSLLLTIISQTVCLDDTVADKMVQKRKLEVVRTVSRLLEREIPLDPTGSNEKHLLHLAITTNNRTLLPLLLAAGVPLTTTESGLGIVQLAWLTPDLTTWVGMVVTRAVVNQLLVEQDIIRTQRDADPSFKETLISGITELVRKLNSERPFEAKWPETTRTTELLVSACKMGTTLTVWYLWQAGGNLFTRVSGHSALEAAVAEGKFSTATRLVLDMRANPFLKDSENKMPVDQFSQDGYLLEVMFGQDYRCLERIMEKAKDSGDKKELQQFIILLMVLFLQYKSRGSVDKWKLYFDKILKTHSQKITESCDWMRSLQDSLKQTGFVLCDWNVCEEIRQIESDYDIDETTGDFYSLFATLEKNFETFDAAGVDRSDDADLLKRAFRIGCELKLPLFLHLVRLITRQDVNTILNGECETRALHHAAKHGNFSAVAYLLDWEASLRYKDCGGLLPIHYAYMYGHKSTGNYLLKQMKRSSNGSADDRNSHIGEKLLPVECLKHLCSSHKGQECADDRVCDVKQSSLAFWHAYKYYLEQYKLDSHFNAESRYLNVRNDKELLKDSLDRIENIWKQNGLRASVNEIAVDYEDQESQAVQRAVSTILGLLRDKIAEKNRLFEGELKFVGSSVDNVRLNCPDEYDCNLVMTNWSLECIMSDADVKEISHEKCLKVSLSLSTPADDNLKELIRGSNFLTKFFNLVKTSLKELDLEHDDLKQLKLLIPGIKRTQVGVSFRFLWLGTKYPMLHVDVDFVPTVRAKWPEGLSRPSWVIEREVSSLQEVFVNSVGKGEWRFSFGFLETEIMQKLTGKQREVFLACKMILSAFKTESWVPRSIKSKFTYWNGQMFSHSSKGGFALKNCFIQELEKITGSQEWEEKNLLKRICSVFSRMCKIYPKSDSESDRSEIIIDPIQVKAYFGGEVETPAMYLIAPEILTFLRSLDDSIIDKQ